jgi:hypothetical protein
MRTRIGLAVSLLPVVAGLAAPAPAEDKMGSGKMSGEKKAMTAAHKPPVAGHASGKMNSHMKGKSRMAKSRMAGKMAPAAAKTSGDKNTGKM